MKSTQKTVPSQSVSSTKRRVGKLKTANDVAKYMASCIRRAEGGGSDSANYKLVMMASMLLKALEVSSLEERLEKLEDNIK
jgi:predicted GTPase